jgi:CheY-like chemotaxis protein
VPQFNIPILLVEDDDIDREAVRRALHKKNFSGDLYEAQDGVEAAKALGLAGEKASIMRPCVILIDINLPRMNGLQLLEKIRTHGDMKQSVVFVLTTSNRYEDKQKAYEMSVGGFFLKNQLENFIDILAQYCRLNQFPVGQD